ncbi:glycosyltransferase [Morganella morganii]
MKIMMLINSFSGGGAEKVFVNLANYFFHHGIDVIYVVGSNEGPNKKKLNTSIKSYSLSKNCSGISILSNSLKLMKILKKQKPDIVFSTLELSNFLNLLFVNLHNKLGNKKIKIVLREANTLTSLALNQKKSALTTLLDYFLKKKSYLSDLIICNSPETMVDIINERKVGNKVKVIPNPVLNERNFLFKKKLRKNRTIKIITAGRLSYQKNQKFLITVVNQLKIEGYDVKLDIYGNGELENELKTLVTNLELESHVFFKGYSDELEYKYKDYDIFCLSSLWEGFGNVFVEALASGLPLLSLDSPGGAKFIIHSNFVGMISSDDIYEYKNKLLDLVTNDTDEKILLRIAESRKYMTNTVSNLYLDEIMSIYEDGLL